jgi:plastocyanin
MQRLFRATLGLALTFALAACGSSTASPAASSGAAPPASAAAATPAGGGAPCAPAAAGATATVKVTIKDFAFSPEPVTAKVGDVVGWTNGDSAGHTASLADGTCTTDTIANGATGALVFSVAGTYAYQCNIHPSQMKGTVTVTG